MSGISYFPTCALQCQQAEALCNEQLNCQNFSTYNCMNILPPGYFVLSPTEVIFIFHIIFIFNIIFIFKIKL